MPRGSSGRSGDAPDMSAQPHQSQRGRRDARLPRCPGQPFAGHESLPHDGPDLLGMGVHIELPRRERHLAEHALEVLLHVGIP